MRLTIRGAFPVFKHEQTDTRLMGFDSAVTHIATMRINMKGKSSYLKGDDRGNQLPLVYMPSNNIYTELNYQLLELGSLSNVGFQINSRVVFEQKELLSSQDSVAVPESYYLIGLKVSAEKELPKLILSLFVRAENLLNETYREYLNRQRYFADDLGFNLIVGVNISF